MPQASSLSPRFLFILLGALADCSTVSNVWSFSALTNHYEVDVLGI